jgi:hypothetical protein
MGHKLMIRRPQLSQTVYMGIQLTAAVTVVVADLFTRYHRTMRRRFATHTAFARLQLVHRIVACGGEKFGFRR